MYVAKYTVISVFIHCFKTGATSPIKVKTQGQETKSEARSQQNSTHEQDHYYKIFSNKYSWLEEVLPVNDILGKLFEKKVITYHEFTNIHEEKNEHNKKNQLCMCLLISIKRQASNFQTLCDILLQTAGAESIGKKLIAGNYICNINNLIL